MECTVKKTELQWLKEGYLINEGAEGELGWNNRYYTYKVMRYSFDQVYKDTDKAKEILRNREKEARTRRKKAAAEEERRANEFEKIRESMHTEYQWLFEYERIPTNPKWENGKKLNYLYKTHSFGENYYYCSIDETREPESSEELSEFQEKYLERRKRPG